jgi:hypothetical protein
LTIFLCVSNKSITFAAKNALRAGQMQNKNALRMGQYTKIKALL